MDNIFRVASLGDFEKINPLYQCARKNDVNES